MTDRKKCLNSHQNRTERNYIKNITSADDLCLFYKNKVSRLEEKYADLNDFLDRINSNGKINTGLHLELQARTTEVSELQQAVGDLQVFLFREREENLRLAAENDKLRIQDYDNNRSLDILLKLSGITRAQLVDLLSSHANLTKVETDKISDDSRKVASSRSNTARSTNILKNKRSGESKTASANSTSTDALLLEVKSLKTQLENLRTLFRNEVDVLLKDREVVAEERAMEVRRFNQQLNTLSTSLQKTQANLNETAKRLLEEREEREREGESWRKERGSMEKQFLSMAYNHDNPLTLTLSGVGTSRTRSCSSKLLQARIGEQEKLANVYHKQCKNLEVEVKKWKERAETAERLFKEKSQSWSTDLAIMRNRYEDLDRRRILEAEGFRTDIRLLRERLKELDKKIIKMKSDETTAAQPPSQSDEELKLSTQYTLKRAKLFEKEVAALKLKFATLTNDMT